MYVEKETIIKGKKIRKISIIIYIIINLIYIIIEGDFELEFNLFEELGMTLFMIVAFYKGNKFIGNIFVLWLVIGTIFLPAAILLYFEIHNYLFSHYLFWIVYVIIIIVGIILIIKSNIFDIYNEFIEFENKNQSKAKYYLANTIFIIIVMAIKIFNT